MTITENTTLEFPSEPGRAYVFSASGDFGEGTISLQWSNGDNWITFADCEFSSSDVRTVFTPTTKIRFLVDGAASPNIEANAILAVDYVLRGGGAARLHLTYPFVGKNTEDCNGIWQEVVLGELDFESKAISADPATGRLTVREAGLYMAVANFGLWQYGSATGGSSFATQLRCNGLEDNSGYTGSMYSVDGVKDLVYPLNGIFLMNAGDYVSFWLMSMEVPGTADDFLLPGQCRGSLSLVKIS